jgi:hypothetical protein
MGTDLLRSAGEGGGQVGLEGRASKARIRVTREGQNDDKHERHKQWKVLLHPFAAGSRSLDRHNSKKDEK